MPHEAASLARTKTAVHGTGTQAREQNTGVQLGLGEEQWHEVTLFVNFLLFILPFESQACLQIR